LDKVGSRSQVRNFSTLVFHYGILIFNSENGDSSYKVRVTHFNEAGHLKDLVRLHSSISIMTINLKLISIYLKDVPAASEPDPETDDTANAEARAFFSGGLKAPEGQVEKQSAL
jgi:hypothetical protein